MENKPVYVCPKCGKILAHNWQEAEALLGHDQLKQHKVHQNYVPSTVLCTSIICVSCGFHGIEDIFMPAEQFYVHKDDEGYYIRIEYGLGPLAITKLYFQDTAIAKLHYTVAQIRNAVDIAELAEALSSDETAIRNEAKQKYDELEGV